MKISLAAKDEIERLIDEIDDSRMTVVDFMEKYENTGICLSCGKHSDGVEPDAEGYHCDSCGNNTVTGIENAIIIYS